MPYPCYQYKGFTLAELLVCLVILSEVATFTIPKIIVTQQSNSYNAKAKEAAAYQQYITQNGANTAIGISDITQYLNYVDVETTSSLDQKYGTAGSTTCNNNGGVCLRLHNGALLQYWPVDYFGGTATINGVPFRIDPEGQLTDTTALGAGKAILFILYYNGRIVDMASIYPGTTYNGGANSSSASASPPWFNW